MIVSCEFCGEVLGENAVDYPEDIVGIVGWHLWMGGVDYHRSMAHGGLPEWGREFETDEWDLMPTMVHLHRRCVSNYLDVEYASLRVDAKKAGY